MHTSLIAHVDNVAHGLIKTKHCSAKAEVLACFCCFVLVWFFLSFFFARAEAGTTRGLTSRPCQLLMSGWAAPQQKAYSPQAPAPFSTLLHPPPPSSICSEEPPLPSPCHRQTHPAGLTLDPFKLLPSLASPSRTSRSTSCISPTAGQQTQRPRTPPSFICQIGHGNTAAEAFYPHGSLWRRAIDNNLSECISV